MLAMPDAAATREKVVIEVSFAALTATSVRESICGRDVARAIRAITRSSERMMGT